ncbi:hypothetical protein FGSG_08092 [Fusarium graminearum PH-1]|uniref:Chromosome 2, complete genome n=1 Tax=Gibberella zeae (strain ATCC MYA-4620 / CBS 123657 / FGSC 9075 / NRRL 31084 / PH-1) TaxID=229533 RepID=I1RV30_GIBZE|nr:hypothetical protein FGSG_08092 [Fusarium graminearum PH-1]ESU15303.1 hypothetical protein FGSG_08092 [Fusarium graminearum PH-1]CEF76351.1 unnamed protein product [Fusarium graminearum]|eukprot:XP_011320728.1 hypothetical protein FGSG_08092 [Fusarium graminearum PH-1]
MTDTYVCSTQRGEEPTLAALPSSQPNVPSIVVGYQAVIPRWSGSPNNPTILRWYLNASTFPDEEEANFAAVALNQAAREWNNVNFGVAVQQTTNKNEANFNLIFKKKSHIEGLLAYAFFPGQKPMNIVVMAFGMDLPHRLQLKNTFLHELGHVFGLRHEFAIEKEQKGAQLWSVPNEDSVMAYKPAPQIQESDMTGIRTFYGLQNGHLIGNAPVTYYMPELVNNS